MDKYRDYGARLYDFCQIKGYKLIADTLDYVVLETKDGYRFQCSGYSLHLAMLKENIK